MRPQGPLIWLPLVAGTATQCPPTLPRYSTTDDAWPLALIAAFMMSSTGTRFLAWAGASQLVNCRMSWPDLACDSATPVSWSLLPCDVM